MTPQEEPKTPPAGQPPVAEPPKNNEVSQASTEGEVHVEQSAIPPADQPAGSSDVKTEPGAQPEAIKRAEPEKPSVPTFPTIAVAIAVAVFAVLAVVAYLAFSRS